MNMLKKTASGIMILVLLLGISACSSKRFSFENIKDVAEQCGLEETDDVGRLAKDIYGMQDYNELVYIATDKPAEAQKIYDEIYNKSNTYPKAEVKAAAVMYSNVINGEGKAISEYALVFTFKNSRKAAEFYNKTEKEFKILDREKGKDKYEYFLISGHNDQVTTLYGEYHEGKTVVLLSGSGYKKNEFTLVDRFCREADVKTPEMLIK